MTPVYLLAVSVGCTEGPEAAPSPEALMWMVAPEETLEREGRCPVEVPDVGVPVTILDGTAGTRLWITQHSIGQSWLSFEYHSSATACGTDVPPWGWYAGWYRSLVASFPTSTPFAITTYEPNASLDWNGIYADHGYAWLCIDEIGPTEGRHDGPAPTSGSFFFYVTDWDADWHGLDDPEPPLPVPAAFFLRIEHNDCAHSEDAGGLTYDPYEDEWSWAWDCDGIDNDLDGEVDEYALDCDRNGVPDCQEHDADEMGSRGCGDAGWRARTDPPLPNGIVE